MCDIVKAMAVQPGFVALAGASPQQIGQAEAALGLKFSQEYRAYVAACGAASFEGHELTGVCPFPQLNVVDVTGEERQNNPQVPQSYYVVERADMDGLVFWQCQEGAVYQSLPGSPPAVAASSLAEYLAL